jgi:hypoxanthine phosphoribosyltransferase
MPKTYYGWIAFNRDIRRLARQIKRKPKNIYGVPRGGLIPAVVLSHLLKRPLILEVEQIGRDTLIVDDVCDSGATLARLANLTKIAVVTLYANEERKIEVPRLLYARPTQGKWIVFPWETERSSKRDNKVQF